MTTVLRRLGLGLLCSAGCVQVSEDEHAARTGGIRQLRHPVDHRGQIERPIKRVVCSGNPQIGQLHVTSTQ